MRLLSHLSITRQFALIGVLAGLSVALPSGLYLRSALKTLHFAQREATATPVVRALYDSIRLTQEHRGLATAALSGNDKAAAQRPAKEAELSKALTAATEQVLHTFGGSDMPAAWAEVTRDWQALNAAVHGGQLSNVEAFQRHTALVTAELALLNRVVDESGWSLDPEANTYFTIVATAMDGIQLTERLGQLRAYGTRLLTKKEVKPEDRLAVHTLVALAQDHHARVRSAFGKAMAADPAYRQAFASALDQLGAQLVPALKLAVDEVVEADTPSHDPNAFFAALTAPIQQQFILNRLGADLLDRTLTERAGAVRSTLVSLSLGCLLMTAAAAALGMAMARSTIKGLQQARSTAQAVAAGDLTLPLAEGGRNELGQLLDALGAMQQHLAGIVSHVRQTADGVATASQQIAQGNLDLSGRTEAQASAIQQTAASMEQLLETVQHNAGHAQQADAVAQRARGLAETGGGAVGEVVGTMEKISHSSNKIADIIGVIDGIAFQTNILALNASVEAARAGEQGRGFAVVASEVRNLAQRATAAAREIKGLIAASTERVEEGAVQVQQAGGTMQEVVGTIQRVADLMRSISAATEQQTASLAQVNAAVSDMDETTQRNAALVEQSAAAASSLQQQARELVDTVAVFRLPEACVA
jgi:methyl-accepting chemotaxis protein